MFSVSFLECSSQFDKLHSIHHIFVLGSRCHVVMVSTVVSVLTAADNEPSITEPRAFVMWVGGIAFQLVSQLISTFYRPHLFIMFNPSFTCVAYWQGSNGSQPGQHHVHSAWLAREGAEPLPLCRMEAKRRTRVSHLLESLFKCCAALRVCRANQMSLILMYLVENMRMKTVRSTGQTFVMSMSWNSGK